MKEGGNDQCDIAASFRTPLPSNLMNVIWAPCTLSVPASQTEASTVKATQVLLVLVAAHAEGLDKRFIILPSNLQ